LEDILLFALFVFFIDLAFVNNFDPVDLNDIDLDSLNERKLELLLQMN